MVKINKFWSTYKIKPNIFSQQKEPQLIDKHGQKLESEEAGLGYLLCSDILWGNSMVP